MARLIIDDTKGDNTVAIQIEGIPTGVALTTAEAAVVWLHKEAQKLVAEGVGDPEGVTQLCIIEVNNASSGGITFRFLFGGEDALGPGLAMDGPVAVSAQITIDLMQLIAERSK